MPSGELDHYVAELEAAHLVSTEPGQDGEPTLLVHEEPDHRLQPGEGRAARRSGVALGIQDARGG